MHSLDILAALRADGWVEVTQKGSHVQLKHPMRPGRVTVPRPRRDLPDRDAQKHRAAGASAPMALRQYIALIHKDPGSDYGVSFPDLPGCVTAGLRPR